MSDRRPNRDRGGRGPRKPQAASVAAHFTDIRKVSDFFVKLGMPASLVTQLTAWLEGLIPGGEMERMEPELTWEGRDARLLIDAVLDLDEEVDVEFTGPPTLIEALQADLDEAFRSKGPPVVTKSTNITWHAGAVTRTDREKLLRQRGVVLWMTGLSGSGKSTVGSLLEKMLVDRGHLAYRLDGDNVRHGLNSNLGFSPDDRAENIRRIGEVAKLFLDTGVIAITSFISPYRQDRDRVRAGMAKGEFVEVYVKANLATAESRDPKGLYKKARAGQIKGFTGIDDPYEEPLAPEVLVDTDRLTPDQGAAAIVQYLESNGYLRA